MRSRLLETRTGGSTIDGLFDNTGIQPAGTTIELQVAGQTIPDLVISKIGTAGKVFTYTLATTHIIADIYGYFPARCPPPALVARCRCATSHNRGTRVLAG